MEQEYKRCRLCGKLKEINEFPIRSDTGMRRNECHECKLNYLKKYRANPEHKKRAQYLNKRYRKTHFEELKEYNTIYQKTHLEKYRLYNKLSRERMDDERRKKEKERNKRYRENHKNDIEYLERVREWSRQSSKRRRKKITAYEEARKKSDPVFKLKKQLRNEVRTSFERRGFRKIGRTEQITGLSSGDLYNWLQQTYEKRYGIFWDGKEEVHIDHIKPLATAHTVDEVIKLNHYTNLQLLKSKDNLEKGAKN